MRAKKIFTILLGMLLFVAFTQSNAQSLRLGFKTGLIFSNVTITPSSTTNARTGLMIGGVAELKVADIFYIQPELEYIMKGCEVVSGGVTYTWKINYIQIPIYMKLKFPLQGAQIKPFVMAGPTFGFNMSATEDYNSGNQSGSNDIKNNIETMDLGLDFGAGAEYSVAPKISLYTSIFYGFGLTNIIKNNPNLTVKNNGFKVNAGVFFNL